jgi:hypothetical protein
LQETNQKKKKEIRNILMHSVRESLLKGKNQYNTVDLLVQTILSKLLNMFLLYKTRYLNEEVNCTEPFPSIRVP